MRERIIQSFMTYYTIALAEHEGAGTAYEYFMKAKVITRFLRSKSGSPKTVLIAGLPEKYGFSFDFVLLSQLLGAELKVIDDRQERLDEFQNIYQKLTEAGNIQSPPLKREKVDDLTEFSSAEKADLAISCEVVQRLENQSGYFQSVSGCAGELILFAPNAENSSHAGQSGLRTIALKQMRDLLSQTGRSVGDSGYIDMPPFPPGISRSEDQREKAQTGFVERFAFQVFLVWGNSERFFPRSIREKNSHIVYVSS
ncbi:MAG: hypothetical protein ACE5GM_09760 [bacterium]